MKIRLRYAILLVALFLLPIANHRGQTTADKWQHYELQESGLAASFPKLPLILETSDICKHQASRAYYAYFDGSVYQISVVRELKGNDSSCSYTKKFTPQALEDRKNELAKTAALSDTSINGRQVARFVGKVSTSLLFDDLKNKRWLEVAVTSHDSERRDSIEFASAVRLNSKGGAVYIDQGAKSMIGDPMPKDVPTPTEDEAKTSKEAESMILVGRPRPSYTDTARSRNEQGVVLLRVQFLANGTIGNIEILKSLKYGLTENAVAAAKQFAFVPARFKGVPVTKIKPVEFSFAIY